MKPKNYDFVDTALGEHVLFTVEECTEQILCIFDEDNECKKIVSDRKSLQGPKSVDIYSEALGSFITRPITIEANDNLFNIPSELPDPENTGGTWRPPEHNASRLFECNTPSTSKLYENDTPSTSSNVSFNKNPTVVPFKFNCCKKQTKVVVCVQCGGAYHRECFNNAGGMLRANDARITCCTEPTNYRVENELRKKIIREMDEKSEMMRENRELLKARVVSLEKSNFPQNELVRSLVTAMDDKCKVLTENRTLLHEKISFLEGRTERPVQNAVSLFQKLISSEIFQQCASLLESDTNQVANNNDQGNSGLINLQNDDVTVAEFSNTPAQLDIESKTALIGLNNESNNLPTINENNGVDDRLCPGKNDKPYLPGKNGLQKLDKCNEIIRNSLQKRKATGFNRRILKSRVSKSHNSKRTIFRKKRRILPYKSKTRVLELISSSKILATDSFHNCDKPNTLTPLEKSTTSAKKGSSCGSMNPLLSQPLADQNIAKLSQESKKSLSQDPPESVQKDSNPKYSSEVKSEILLKDKRQMNELNKSEIIATSKDNTSTEQFNNIKKKDSTKNLSLVKTTTKKQEQINSAKDVTKLIKNRHSKSKSSHHHRKSSHPSSSDKSADNNSVKVSTGKDKPLTKNLEKNLSIMNNPSKSEETINSIQVSHKKYKKTDTKHRKVNEATAEETKKTIAENQKSCKTTPADDSLKIIKNNETITNENSSSVIENSSTTVSSKQKDSSTQSRIIAEDIKSANKTKPNKTDKKGIVAPETKKGTEAESSSTEQKTTEGQQKSSHVNNAKKKTDDSSKNHKNPIRKENVNNNGDRLHEVINKIQNKYKSPLKTQIINNTPIRTLITKKAFVLNKTPIKAVLNKTTETLVVNKTPLKTGIVKKILTKSPKNRHTSSKKRKKSFTPSKEERDLLKREKLKDNLAHDIRMAKNYFAEEKEKTKKASAQHCPMNSVNQDDAGEKLNNSVSTVESNKSSKELENEANTRNLSCKEEASIVNLDEDGISIRKGAGCNQWKPSDVKIQVHPEYANQDDMCEGLHDGEYIHVDNVNEDDAASDYPDDNLEESIYINEEVAEEESDSDMRVKEEDNFLDEDTVLDQEPTNLQSPVSFFTSIRCKQEEFVDGLLQESATAPEQTNVDDFKSVSTLHHEIKLESDDKVLSATGNEDVVSCLANGEDNKTSLSLLVESNSTAVEDGGNNLVKGENEIGIILDEANSQRTSSFETKVGQDVQKKASKNLLYSPILESDFLSPRKNDTNKKPTSTPISTAKSGGDNNASLINQCLDENTMYSLISNDDEDSPCKKQSGENALSSDEDETIEARKGSLLKDSSAARVLNFESNVLSITDLEKTGTIQKPPTQINLLQVVNLPNSNTLLPKKEQKNKSKVTGNEEGRENITKSSSSQECKIRSGAEESKNLNKEKCELHRGQEENQANPALEDQSCSRTTATHYEQAVAPGASNQCMSTATKQKDTVVQAKSSETTTEMDTSSSENALEPSTPDPKTLENQNPTPSITTRFKRSSLCSSRGKSAPSTSRSSVVVRPYCWTYRTPNNAELQNPAVEETLSHQEPGAQNDSGNSTRRFIQVRRDLTVEDLNRTTHDGSEDPTRRWNIQVRRDLVQRSEDLGEPSGLIQVRRDLIHEDLGRTSGQIQVRRDLVQPPGETSRSSIIQSGEIPGQITVRKDLVQRVGEASGQLTIRTDLLSSAGEASAKIKVRRDLVQRAEDAPGTSRSLNQEDGDGQSGKRWSIKVRKDLQQPIEDLETTSEAVDVVPETAQPLNLCLQEVGTFPSTSRVGECVENPRGEVKQILKEETKAASKKYIKVRKDLGADGSDQSGSSDNHEVVEGIRESSLNPIINNSLNENPNKMWSIKVRKDLGQAFDNTEEESVENTEIISPVAEFEDAELETLEDLEGTPCLPEEIDESNNTDEVIPTDFLPNTSSEINETQDTQEHKQSGKRWSIKVRTDLVQNTESNQTSSLADIVETKLQGLLQDPRKLRNMPSLEVAATESLNMPSLEVAETESPAETASPVLQNIPTLLEIVEGESPAAKPAPVLQNKASLEIVDTEPSLVDQGLGNPPTTSHQDILNAKENDEEISCETEINILNKSQNDEEISEINEKADGLKEPQNVVTETLQSEAILEAEDAANDSQNKNESLGESEVIDRRQNDEAILETDDISNHSQNEEVILRESDVNEESNEKMLEIDEEINNDEIDEDKVLNEFQNDEDDNLEELEIDEEETLLNKTHIEPMEPQLKQKYGSKQEVVKVSSESRETNEALEEDSSSGNKEVTKSQEIESPNTKDSGGELVVEDGSEIPNSILSTSFETKSPESKEIELSDYEESDAPDLTTSDLEDSSVTLTEVVRTSPKGSLARVGSNIDDVMLIPSDASNVTLIQEEATSNVLVEENHDAFKNDEFNTPLTQDPSAKKSPTNQNVAILLDEEFPKPSTVPVADYIKEYRILCAAEGVPKETATVVYSESVESEPSVVAGADTACAEKAAVEIEEGEIASSSDETTLVIDESASTSKKRKNKKSKRNKGHEDSMLVDDSSVDDAHSANLQRRLNKMRKKCKEDYDRSYAEIVGTPSALKIQYDLRKLARKNKRREKKMAEEAKKKFEMLYDPIDITLGEQVRFQMETFTEHINCVHDPSEKYRRITWDTNLLRSRTRMVEIFVDALDKNITRPITLEGNDDIIQLPASRRRRRRYRKRVNDFQQASSGDVQDNSKGKEELLSVKNVNVNVNCDKSIDQPSGSRSDSASSSRNEFDMMDYCFTLRGGKRKADRDSDEDGNKSPKKLLRKIDVEKFLDMIHNSRDTPL